MLLLRRSLRPARRALSTATTPTDFASLALEDGQVLPRAVVTRRVLEYLRVEPTDLQRAVSDDKSAPLPYKALFSPKIVEQLTPLVQWGFRQLDPQSGSRAAADAVFTALQPHASMAKGAVWRQYFQRQFFLSGAPLAAYLRAYKSHRDALPARPRADPLEEGEEDEDEENEEPKQARSTSYDRKNTFSILAEDQQWEWVPLPLASGLVQEYCFRGRFAEAIDAYKSLPLTNGARRKVVQVLEDYEQYPSVLYLYDVHRSAGSAVQPLDVAPELRALKKLGRADELDVRFLDLPIKEQSRADIQELMGN